MNHPPFCRVAILERQFLNRLEEFHALPASSRYVEQDVFFGECTTWIKRNDFSVATEVPHIRSQSTPPPVWMNLESREGLVKCLSVRVPMERSTHGRVIVGGGQPAAEEPFDVTRKAVRGFEDPTSISQSFHMRMPLRKLLRELPYLPKGSVNVTDEHKWQTNIHEVLLMLVAYCRRMTEERETTLNSSFSEADVLGATVHLLQIEVH